MCQPRSAGGQRCAAHTRPAYTAAEPGTAAWDQAAAQHASTPTGETELRADLSQAVRGNDIHREAALRTALDAGARIRAASTQAKQMVETPTPYTWAHVEETVDMGIHAHQIRDYIVEHMPNAQWTRETHPVTDQMPDPNNIRSTSRMAQAEDGYRNNPDTMPPVIVLEHNDGRREHVDGWHRLGAAHKVGLTHLDAWVGRPAATTEPPPVPDSVIAEADTFARDYCDASGGARAGMCHAAAWNVREEFGWPIVSGERGGVPHHWNQMPDGRWFDPTAAQFGDDGPAVIYPTDDRYRAAPERNGQQSN